MDDDLDYLFDWFPELESVHWRKTSDEDDDYNCIAWAAGNDRRWWWPNRLGRNHWPSGVPPIPTLDAFRRMFATLGYSECESESYEDGWERVAVYAKDVLVTHAARQVGPKRWTSKLGYDIDIEHELRGLEGKEYGYVKLVLRRPNQFLLFWVIFLWYHYAPIGPTKG